ncbi:MAG TPA: hypothetical protein VH349_18290 [Ktedonobacterales bacterium]|jgi:hypothetical protein
MFQHIFVTLRHVVRPVQTTRRVLAALMIGLAVLVSACGIGQSGSTATSTPKPTATTTPTPCTTWRIIPSPNSTQYPSSGLSAVSALSPTSAWAVGSTSYMDGGPIQSLTEQWDGSTWHVMASPGKDGLGGVAVVSATDVWAVGSLSSHQVRPTTMIEHWNGTQWSLVSSPNPGPLSDTLNGVAAISASEVWAVGESVTATNATQPLIERWDGANWHIIPSPTLPSGTVGGTLNSVVALSATDAWVVGDYTASEHTHALIAHWDGDAWKLVAGPDSTASLTLASLGSVAVAGAQDVRAVGHTYTTDGVRHPWLIQWNGATWQVVPTPQPSAAVDSELNSIATDGTGNFWVVGSYRETPLVDKTLTLHCP